MRTSGGYEDFTVGIERGGLSQREAERGLEEVRIFRFAETRRLTSDEDALRLFELRAQ